MTFSQDPNQTSPADQPPAQPGVLPPEERPQPQIRLVLPDTKPTVTYTIIAITVLVFLAQQATRTFFGTDIPANLGIKFNPLIDAGEYWRLIAPVLLHGSVLHIGFNMYALYILGRELETAAPSLGASTAVFGLLAAYGILGYRNQRIFGPQSQRIVRNVIQVAAINFLFGLSPGIDNWGHLGGAIGGLLVAWFGGPEFRFAGQMIELHLEDKTSLSQFMAIFFTVLALFAALALFLGGAS
ncbi:MAG: rhomboid family intramembrane serine protease [Anaerolineales bacterium]